MSQAQALSRKKAMGMVEDCAACEA
jgi:hypothetical protein